MNEINAIKNQAFYKFRLHRKSMCLYNRIDDKEIKLFFYNFFGHTKFVH